jgi:glycogen synthase
MRTATIFTIHNLAFQGYSQRDPVEMGLDQVISASIDLSTLVW